MSEFTLEELKELRLAMLERVARKLEAANKAKLNPDYHAFLTNRNTFSCNLSSKVWRMLLEEKQKGE